MIIFGEAKNNHYIYTFSQQFPESLLTKGFFAPKIGFMQNPFWVFFVCMGNIIRSPLAENLFLREIVKRGLADRYAAASAGTDSYHVGQHPDARMRQVAARRGFLYDGRARQFERRDFDRFNLILVMDRENFSTVLTLARTPQDSQKIHLLREFDPQGGPGFEVPDPYYGGADGFERVYEIVERSVIGVVDALETGKIGSNS